MSHSNPPKLPFWLLRQFCKDRYRSDIEGDLMELFKQRVDLMGANRARWLLYKDVILLFRPGIIGNFQSHSNFQELHLLPNYLKSSFRSFNLNRGAFIINLIGLSTGLACTFLICLWLADELRIDKFHKNDANLYQVYSNFEQADGVNTWNGTSAMLADALESEIPEIQTAVGATDSEWQMQFNLSVDDRHVKSIGKFVGEDYFELFSYDLLHGDEESILSDKEAIVISEDLAKILFASTDQAIGKTIEWQLQKGRFTSIVSGIFESLPSSSTDQFNLLLPFDLYQQFFGSDWNNLNSVTFVLVEKNADVHALNHKIRHFLDDKIEDNNTNLFLHAYSDNYLYSKFEDGQQVGGRIEYVRMLTLVALFILGIALINFMNLATAKSSKQMKDMAVKKFLGARRKSLILQYLSKSVLLSLLSLVVALLIVRFCLPFLNQITGKQIKIMDDPSMLWWALSLAIFTGLFAGLYPAFYISRLKPSMVLKGNISKSMGELWVRKGLVVFQFSLSIIFIVAVLVLYRQMEFIQLKDLGYERDNVLLFPNEGKVAEDLTTFLHEIKKLPGVSNASSVTNDLFHPPGVGDLQLEGKKIELADFGRFAVNYDFIETLGLQVIEGRSFNRAHVSRNEIILNESAVRDLGLRDPIGAKAILWGNNMKIVGVVKDFHFRSLHKPVGPMLFHLFDYSNNILVRINPGMEKKALPEIENFYRGFNPGYTFDYTFLDKKYDALYRSEQSVTIISKYFMIVAVLISCLGLFGLASHTAERRRKEISIRKILGSSSFQIVRLLSSTYTKMVLMSIVISLPLCYVLARHWLNGYAYHIDLNWWYFLSAAGIALALNWLVIGHQTLRAALAHPIESLREE